jgi:hypothetical protein
MTLPQSPLTLPHSARTGEEAHADAIERCAAARDDQARLHQAEGEAQGSARELSARTDLSEANERLAASEAWLRYTERGY